MARHWRAMRSAAGHFVRGDVAADRHGQTAAVPAATRHVQGVARGSRPAKRTPAVLAPVPQRTTHAERSGGGLSGSRCYASVGKAP